MGGYIEAVLDRNLAENISRVLYPNDNVSSCCGTGGKGALICAASQCGKLGSIRAPMRLTLVSGELPRVRTDTASPTGPRSPRPHTSSPPHKDRATEPSDLTCPWSLLFSTWCGSLRSGGCTCRVGPAVPVLQ